MREEQKSNDELIDDLKDLRVRNAELEAENKKLREIEQSLHESEEKYRAIYDASPDYICVTDTAGNYLDANPALLKRMDLSIDQLRQKSVLDFFSGEGLKKLGKRLSGFKAGQVVRGYEEKGSTPQGGIFIAKINAVLLAGDGVTG